ncbi:flagellin [Comamonas flocculans]
MASTERFSINGTPATNVTWGNNGVLDGSFTIQGTQENATIRIHASDTAAQIAARINTRTETTGVTATADTTARLQFDTPGAYILQLRSDNGTPQTVGFQLLDIDSPSGLSAAIDAFNAISSKTGVYATYDADGKSVLLRHPTGNDIMLSDTSFQNAGDVAVSKSATGMPFNPAGVLFADVVAENAVVSGQVVLDSHQSFSIDTLDTRAFDDEVSTLHPVSELDISTVEGANDAIKTADAALAHVSGARSRLGALQSRFETAVANLSISTENQSAARSRIQDADFAKETADLARAQILQQAGTAMVAQANQIPQGVLALLNL